MDISRGDLSCTDGTTREEGDPAMEGRGGLTLSESILLTGAIRLAGIPVLIDERDDDEVDALRASTREAVVGERADIEIGGRASVLNWT
jgi:hypothetical protein